MFKYINIRNSVAAVAALAGAACVYKAFTAKTAKAKALWAVAALLLLGGGGGVLWFSAPMGDDVPGGTLPVDANGEVIDPKAEATQPQLPPAPSPPMLELDPLPTPDDQPDVIVIDPSAHVNVNPVDGGFKDPAQGMLNKEAAVRMLKAWKLPPGVDRATLQAMFGFEDDGDSWSTPEWGRTGWVIPLLKHLYRMGGAEVQSKLQKFVDGLPKSSSTSGKKYWIDLNPPTTPGDEFPARIQLTEFVDFVNSQRG